MDWLRLGLRTIIGGVLIFSGISKMPVHSEFIVLVNSYHILPVPLATAYAVTLPWVELIAGAYLILGILLRISAALTVLMGISYAVANVSAILSGEQHCASCFGQSVSMPVAYSLAIDVLIVGASLYLTLRSNRSLTLAQWLGTAKNDEARRRGK